MFEIVRLNRQEGYVPAAYLSKINPDKARSTQPEENRLSQGVQVVSSLSEISEYFKPSTKKASFKHPPPRTNSLPVCVMREVTQAALQNDNRWELSGLCVSDFSWLVSQIIDLCSYEVAFEESYISTFCVKWNTLNTYWAEFVCSAWNWTMGCPVLLQNCFLWKTRYIGL